VGKHRDLDNYDARRQLLRRSRSESSSDFSGLRALTADINPAVRGGGANDNEEFLGGTRSHSFASATSLIVRG